MNRDEHRQLRESLGAFALGQLTEEERVAVQSHVDGCAECQAELATIAPLAGPLRDVDPARLGAQPAPPAELREAILARVRSERPRRRRTVIAVAAAVVALAAGLTIGYLVAPRPAPLPLEPVAVTTERAGIDVRAELVAHTWGTEIKLTGTGFATGRPYRVMVLDRSGTERVAGEFVGTGAQSMKCNLNSAVLRGSATGFVVRDSTDTVVVSSTF